MIRSICVHVLHWLRLASMRLTRVSTLLFALVTTVLLCWLRSAKRARAGCLCTGIETHTLVAVSAFSDTIHCTDLIYFAWRNGDCQLWCKESTCKLAGPA